jgi:hypothetical protein
MSQADTLTLTNQQDEEVARSLLDQLLADSRLYKTGQSYKDLLQFVTRLRNVAPFNAMLLQLQKPGLTYAASAFDWKMRFGRHPREDARPLLILWPFGPVATVYDVQDTEGDPLPEDVAAFFTTGSITAEQLTSFKGKLDSKNIAWCWVDSGDAKAGKIKVVKRGDDDKKATEYEISINRNHDTATQFVTLSHELGHLFLGHLGEDKKLKVSKRRTLTHAEVELEAESVAYLVCHRSGVKPKSQIYLSNFINQDTGTDQLDLYKIMHAAGQVETILGLTANTKFEKPEKGEPP